MREGCLAAKKDAYTAVRMAKLFTGDTMRCSKLGGPSGLPSPNGFDGPGSRRLMSAAVVLLRAAWLGELFDDLSTNDVDHHVKLIFGICSLNGRF